MKRHKDRYRLCWKWGVWECFGTVHTDGHVDDLFVYPNTDGLVVTEEHARDPYEYDLPDAMVGDICHAGVDAMHEHVRAQHEFEAEAFGDRERGI